MADTTVTRAHLSQALHEEVGLSHNECAELLETVLREISGALIEGGSVKISGYGSFSTRQKNERIGRNPKTGEEVTISRKLRPKQGLDIGSKFAILLLHRRSDWCPNWFKLRTLSIG